MEGIHRIRPCFWICALVCCPWLRAADEHRLAMVRDAQAAFDKLALAPHPVLADASACVTAQAAMLSVALPAEESELHYRKGFCELALASINRSQAGFRDAADELDRAGAGMLAFIARQAGKVSDQPGWNQPDRCPQSCEPLLPVANLWLGYLALNAGNPDAAAIKFAAHPESGWYDYVTALQSFQSGRYAEAVARDRQALAIWTRTQHLENPSLAVRLSPPVDIPRLLTDLGGAQIVAGDPPGAIATLDRAIQAAPGARAYFLRARAKELTGQPEPALADYNLASRAAFASAADMASGEAHLYRGILLYRRKDYARAEEEFSSALNFEISPALRPDATAWRHLSAVASGFCGASRQFLESSLPSVSPYFPKAEAQAVAAGCPAGSPP